MCILFVRVGEICANTNFYLASSLLNMKYVPARTLLMQLRIAETVVPWYYDVSVIVTGRNEVVAKVMFLLVSMILLTGGVSASVHAGIPLPLLGADNPPPPEQTTPGSRHPPEADTPPWKQTPGYGQWAAGTHPTGMHSCFVKIKIPIATRWRKMLRKVILLFLYCFAWITSISNKYYCSSLLKNRLKLPWQWASIKAKPDLQLMQWLLSPGELVSLFFHVILSVSDWWQIPVHL